MRWTRFLTSLFLTLKRHDLLKVKLTIPISSLKFLGRRERRKVPKIKMAMQLKSGVRLLGVSPEMVIGIMIIKGCFEDLDRMFTITSVTDGKHSKNSLHYSGNAVDVRIRHLDDRQIKNLEDMMIARLGSDFDVVKHSTHIHVEYQPHGTA